MKKPATPDEYLSRLPARDRGILTALRVIIRSVEPNFEERMSSGAPFFWFHGKRAVGFGAAKRHLSFFIMHGAVLKTHRKYLASHDTSNTVVRFKHDKPLPSALIRKLVRARIAEIASVRISKK